MTTRRLTSPGPAALLWMLVAAVLLATPARAQPDASVTAMFRQEACFLGDEVIFEIAVENVDSVEPPDLSATPGAEFVYRGTNNESRTSVIEINGRRQTESTRRLVMQWIARPTESGALAVDPVSVRVDGGRTLTTQRAVLRVIEPEAVTRHVLRVEPKATTLYVNQPTRVRVIWVLTADVNEPSFRGSAIDPGLSVQPVGPPAQGQGRQLDIDIFGVRTVGSLGYATLDGERFRSLEFEVVVTPTRAGEMTLGPVTVAFDEYVSRRATKRMIARADPVTLSVRDLPTEGRPASFSGLLGVHAIEASATPTAVSVGDPITLEVAVYGPEPMPGVLDGPDLAATPGFAEGFRLASDGWTRQVARKPGERRFTTIIRAAHDGVTEIPAIPLAFFDPGEGEYRVARSKPIPLSVRAVREITAADAVISTGAASVSREGLTPTAAGLWAIDRGPAVLARSGGLNGALSSPAVVAALVAPPGVFAVAAVTAIARSRRVDEAARRRRDALRAARRALRRDGPAGAVRAYLAGAFGLTPAAITGADGRRLIHDPAAAEAVSELIAVHEAARYGSPAGHADAASEGQRVLELLGRVDRSLRGRA